jgi:uncharacterized membrane protein (DUF373 family)
MNGASRGTTILRLFELTVVMAAGLLLALAVAVAVVMLFVLFFDDLYISLSTLSSVGALQATLQDVFGGVLLVLLGLELIDTLKVYFLDHHIRTEVILVVAMIAVGRHIIQIDFEHTGGSELIGTAAISVALAVSYFLVKKARSDPVSTPPSVTPEHRSERATVDGSGGHVQVP